MNNYDYMKLPYDLSGSMSKNRFRNELLWGLKKIFQLHKEGKNYIVVFDYACDVEVHLQEENKFEYYQLKTENREGKYKLTNLIRPNKGKSILGKLYILKYCTKGLETDCVKLGIVSNSPLFDGKKTYNTVEEFDFKNLDIIQKKNTIDKLEKELSKNVSLDNTFFIRTGMDLFSPDTTLTGETAKFFKELYKEEPKKINTLFSVLASEIERKACYELKPKNYDELIEKKGLNKDLINDILKKYIDNTDVSVEKTKSYIEKICMEDFPYKLHLINKLSSLIIDLKNNNWLLSKEFEIVHYIRNNLGTLPKKEKELIEYLAKKFQIKTFDYDDKIVFVILILKRLEEEVYE